ncbi:MAG TPA: lysylphosphatidylglycerol synthase domain-containing protein [Kofleriaceae bacterium]|nr:lysylphosphatidylglycerol synthase domain-containing protein [Kofleriaceae bacterium]
MTTRVLAAARSAPGRVALVTCAIAGVALILRRLGIEDVGRALAGAAPYFPLIVVLEAGVLTCTMCGLRSLYGEAGAGVPLRQYVRAGLVGYALMGLVPAGRTVAEGARASMLARWVGAGRAGAAAARLQAAALIANAAISIPATIAVLVVIGPTWLALAIAINAAVTLVLGLSLLAIGRRARVGAWLGRRIARAKEFGAELDAAFEREPFLPWRAIGWELCGRVVQVAQNAVLIAIVGGAFSIASALCSESVHLVGAAVGDLIPAQLGATESNYTLAAHALGLPGASAVSIALLAHLAQLVWVVVGSLVPLVWRAPAEV